MANTYTNLKKLSDKHGEMEFQAEIPADTLEEYIADELARYASEMSAPGFRKGKVPEQMVRERVGEMDLLEGAADEALRDAMRGIVDDEKLDVLGRPELTVTKIAPKNPLEFKIRYAISPEVSLPDYRKIGKTVWETKEELAVKDEEIDEAIGRIREITGTKGEQLTDEDVKKFGPFENVAAFRAEVAKSLTKEKEVLAEDRKRDEMIKQIVAQSKVKVPEMLVTQELREFIADRDRQIEAAGLSLDEYLKQIKKTAEELEKQEHALIEDDIKTSLVIKAIKDKESLDATEREIQIGIARLKLRYPDRDEDSLRRTAEATAVQEKLFTLLEGDKKEEEKASPEQ